MSVIVNMYDVWKKKSYLGLLHATLLQDGLYDFLLIVCAELVFEGTVARSV